MPLISSIAPGRWTTRLATGSAILLLSGCVSIGPQPGHAALRDDAAAHSSRALGALATAPAAWPAQDWWRAYGDPQLDRLVERARAGSPTVAVALARVRQASALEGVVGSALSPQASA